MIVLFMISEFILAKTTESIYVIYFHFLYYNKTLLPDLLKLLTD